MRKPAAIFAFLLIASSCLVAAQQQNTSFQVSNTPQTVTPEEIIRQFGATEMTSYTLGNGDEITVDVWNHAELSGHHVIGPDGKITLPIAGVLKVAGLTREEAQTAVMNGPVSYTHLTLPTTPYV